MAGYNVVVYSCTHTHTLTHILTLSLTHNHTHIHTLTHIQTHSHALSLTHIHTFTHTVTLKLSFPFITAVTNAFPLHVNLCDIIGDSVS